MIDFETLDNLYTVDVNSGLCCYLHSKKSLMQFEDELKVSEAFELVRMRKIKKAFSIDPSFATLQDYVHIRQLNEEAKIVDGDNFVMMFTHLENFVTKEPITIPTDIFQVDKKWVQSSVEFVNKVLWLTPLTNKEIKKELESIERMRKNLKNMLKYNQTSTVEELIS